MNSFLTLKSALQALAFDPEKDALPEGFAEYCCFYQLDTLIGQHRIGTVDSGSYRLAVQYWLPDNAHHSVLIVHGYFDHVGLYRHVIRFFLSRGYAVIAFDLPGHGLSSGARAVIYDFDEYSTAISNIIRATGTSKLPPISIAFGQSTGCAAWMNFFMSGFPSDVQQLILFSPLLRPHRWQTEGRWLYAALRHVVQYIPRNFRDNSSDQAFLNFCHHVDPLQPRYLTVAWVGAMKKWLDRFHTQAPIHIPTLILQGERDDTVDWRFNIPNILQKIPQAQLHWLAEAHHHLANESASIRTRLWQIMNDFLDTHTGH